jgi:hypothetical protein
MSQLQQADNCPACWVIIEINKSYLQNIISKPMLKPSSQHSQAYSASTLSFLSGSRSFGIVLFAILLSIFCFKKEKKIGDFTEYGIMTIAVASHGTPDIRLSDVEQAKHLNPEPDYFAFYEELGKGIQKDATVPVVGFYRGHDARFYSLHFFTHSALAAIPFIAFKAMGIPPFKCYLFVNLAFVFILGMACFGFFKSGTRAVLAMVLFAFCGGALYWDWSSPELMTAASLLAGLLFYFSGRPIAAGVLAGLASMQNPSLVFFAGFAPLLAFAYRRTLPSAREFAALAIVVLLFSLTVLFNLVTFGVPSILAATSTDFHLIGGTRLHSLFFDLNQGMLIGIPGLFAALAAILLFGKSASVRLLACCIVLFAIAMAIPAMTPHNWNSGATGMMRYASWAAMPILFGCLLYARDHKVSGTLIAALLLVQIGATWMEQQYSHVQFSPLARFFLGHFPSAYNPAFEIFSERLANAEAFVPKDSVLYYTDNGKVTKIAFNLENSQAGQKLCGKNKALSPDNHVTVVDNGWAYLNTKPVCVQLLTEDTVFTAREFKDASSIRFTRGWDKLELGGANWDGIWTVGPVARIDIATAPNLPYQSLTIHGQYVAAGMETEVFVNGVDLGRYALDRGLPISVKSALSNKDGHIAVELRHAPGKKPEWAAGDPRPLGFFVNTIALH